MKNNLIIAAVAALVLGGVVGFLGGMQYKKSKRPSFAGAANRGGQFAGRFGAGANAANRPVTGQIISADDKSITVKMQDGSSKIVILSTSTTINKQATGSTSDLKTGTNVMVLGTTNSDGSVTAQSVQLNPVFRGARPTPTP